MRVTRLLTAPALALALGCSASSDDSSRARGNQGQGNAPGAGGGSNVFGTGSSGGANLTDPSGSGGGGGRETCGSLAIDTRMEEIDLPGNVLIIFDQSNSMTANFDTPAGPLPRWQAASRAISDAIAPVADQLTVGSIVFPTSSALALCSAIADPITSPNQINFRPGRDFVQAWDQYWSAGAGNLVLGTPINRAFDVAAGALAGAQLTGKIVVIMVGDGEPVCTDGVPADQRAAEWLGLGIDTHVIGLPDSSIAAGAPLLSAVAAAGGTGDFITPLDSAQLTQDLAQIASTAVTRGLDNCNITLDPPPEDPAKTFLIVEESVGGQRFQVPPSDGAGNGWVLSADATTATLTGAVCDGATGGRFSNITFEFGCVELPPLIY